MRFECEECNVYNSKYVFMLMKHRKKNEYHISVMEKQEQVVFFNAFIVFGQFWNCFKNPENP
jgi:hypothetical protein